MLLIKRILAITSVLVISTNLVFAQYVPKAKAISNTPTGNVSSTNVQDAINELDTEKVATSRTVNGQALSADVSITTITGNAATATSLATTPTSCNAGYFPLGIDASGNSQNCTQAGGSVGGSDTQVQFNNAGSFGGNSGFVYKGTNVGIGTALPRASLEISNQMIFASEFNNGNSGAAKTIAWTNGNKQKVTLTDNCTFTFTAPQGVGDYTLKIVMDGMGGYTNTWPATVKWPGGYEPAMTLFAGATEIINFYFDGTNYLASWGSDLVTGTGVGTPYLPHTSGSAIQKANGSGGLTAAVASTDYVGATSGSSIQKADGSGGLTAAADGTDYTLLVGMTTNYVQKATAANTIGDSSIVDDGTNVGIGSVNPTAPLDLASTGGLLSTTKATTSSNAAYESIGDGTNSLLIGTESDAGAGIFTSGSANASVIGSNSTNVLQLATNNAVRMTVDSGGNVGIGTLSPIGAIASARLSLYNAASSAGLVIKADGSTNNSHLRLRSDDGTANSFNTLNNSGTSNTNLINIPLGYALYNTGSGGTSLGASNAAGNLYFFTGSTTGERMRIDSVGNVGIQDTTPDAQLEVVKSGSISPLMISSSASGDGDYFQVNSAGNVGIGTSNVGTGEDVYINSTANHSSMALRGTGSGGNPAAYFYMVEGSNNGYYQIEYDRSDLGGLTFYKAGTQVIFDANGNVGIGTTLPSTDLEIAKTSGNYITLTDTTADSNSRRWGISNSGGPSYGTLDFLVATNNTATPSSIKMTINSAGNVGINDTTPDAMLESVKSGSSPVFMASSSASGDGDYLTVTSAGNVGIGTVSPNNLLNIKGGGIREELPTSTTAIMLSGRTGNTFGFDVLQDTSSTGDMFINRVESGSSSEVIRYQRSSGNVGIGGTPSYKLDVTGQIRVGNNGSNSSPSLLIGSAVSQTGINHAGSGVLDIVSGGTGTLRVSGANVGIGSTAPGSTLDIVGQTRTINTNSIGWSVVAGANTDCNTTCTFGCVLGFANAVAGASPVGCTDGTADNCLCAGAN